MPSIKIHPDYPFIRIGLAFDMYPELAVEPEGHVVQPDEWTIDSENKGLDGASYWSEAPAFAAVEGHIFDGCQSEMLERQLRLAKESGNWPLALRLVDGRARAEGYRKAKEELTSKLSPLREDLRDLFRSLVLSMC